MVAGIGLSRQVFRRTQRGRARGGRDRGPGRLPAGPLTVNLDPRDRSSQLDGDLRQLERHVP